MMSSVHTGTQEQRYIQIRLLCRLASVLWCSHI